ncbi:GntR family transcriptional regulator [Paraburkholderia sp.]|uniref:GntR family transcriptional regulator n=1 Tax=Paraburkholderia sp. TaxID=1926495 RepID=UPI003C7B440C
MNIDMTHSFKSELKVARDANRTPLTKREYAIEAIRSAIHTGYFLPGQVVSQRQLADDLGLSLTPLREALIQLGATGLIERHNHHSIKIREVDQEYLVQIYQVRMLLELEVVRLAVRHVTGSTLSTLKQINDQLRSLIGSREVDRIEALDRQFHEVFFAASGNQPLLAAIQFAKNSFPLYALWSKQGRLELSVAEHDTLIDALEAGDLHAAVRNHEAHLNSGLKAALSQVTQPGFQVRQTA